MPGSPNGSDAHTNIFLYSHPRTRSNLLIRLLETHPQVMSKQYPFLFCFQKGPESQWTEETKIGIFEASGETLEEAEKKYAHLTFQAGLDDMERLLAEAQMKVGG
ncbi:hypothetical protein GYMLUDRAFT_39760 [Collybiopsis luxurians FD-317 M1]|nr:hypothetical protein GYMLUDRAFT_39760 [Collybiopsis luxurians FD-317 M1]